ncbi:MAG: glycosyltransferase family 4 protein [bacterium]|nr:glycosyltransferase family 4 protein [bacterium]
MRIHLVTDQFCLGGGIEHIFQVAKGLPQFQFGIFGEPGPASGKFRDLPNVDVYDTGFDPSLVLESSPDIVHIHHLRPLTAFFRNPFRKYNVPVLFTVHGLHIHKFEFYKSLTAKLKYFLRFRLEKNMLPKADRIIAVSREDQRFMEENYGLTHVDYVTNGIDGTAVKAAEGLSKADLTGKLDVPPGAFLFVTVARFNFQKGYDFLLQTIAKIKPRLERMERLERPCRFLLVGDGPELDAMKELSRSLSISRYVRFLGARRDVYDILKASDVFLLPSRWEGLPIVLLETGLLEVPVVASDTYGNREIIGENNGILFRNLDQNALAGVLLDVLGEKYDLKKYAENLYREVQENYSLEKMLAGLEKTYRSFQ